jgi:cell division protein FtsX
MNDNKQRERLVVVDTSALMDIPDVMNRIYGKFYVPLTVIKQLDGLKNIKDEERSKMARRASYFIENGPQVNAVTILTEYDRVDGLNNESDNKIVGAAVRLMKTNPMPRLYCLPRTGICESWLPDTESTEWISVVSP